MVISYRLQPILMREEEVRIYSAPNECQAMHQALYKSLHVALTLIR